jgi:hypothetical protein
MSRSSVCLRLVEVAWDDGDHDEPQRVDAPAGAIVAQLVEHFDPSVAFSQIKITYAEARELIEDLFGHRAAEKLPTKPPSFSYHEFKIPRSGGWEFALGYRRDRVFANLLAPEDVDFQPSSRPVSSRPVTLTRAEFEVRHYPERVA